VTSEVATHVIVRPAGHGGRALERKPWPPRREPRPTVLPGWTNSRARLGEKIQIVTDRCLDVARRPSSTISTWPPPRDWLSMGSTHQSHY